MNSGSAPASILAAVALAALLAAPASAARVADRGVQLRVRGPAVVAKVRLRARAHGCRRASATLLVDGRAAGWATFGRRARRAKLAVVPAASRTRLRVLIGGCDLTVLSLRGVAPAAVKAPAAAPVAVTAPATAPVLLGAAVSDAGLSNRVYAATLLSAFGSITPENELKMNQTQPSPARYDFRAADRVIDFATAHRLAIRGHTLIFGAATPDWVRQQQLPALIEQTLKDRIQTVVTRYRDRIREWDVVNEALATNGGWRHNAFYDALGQGYVETAFRAARAADPTAKLFYNEIGAEYDNAKQRTLLALMRRLAGARLVDGIGLQMHVSIEQAPTYEQLVNLMHTFAAMGLEVELTEMDVAAGGLAPLGDRLSRQAEVYATAGRACRAVPACKRVTVWGVSDKVSWLSPAQLPLLFDADYHAKPALDALRTALGTLPVG